MHQRHIAVHTFKIAPETRGWVFTQEVRKEHDNEQNTKTGKDTRKLRSILHLIKCQHYPRCKHYVDNNTEPKVFTSNKREKVIILHVEGQKWDCKQTRKDDRFQKVFHMSKTISRMNPSQSLDDQKKARYRNGSLFGSPTPTYSERP